MILIYMSAIYHNLTNWKRSGCPFIDCDPGERERECTPSLEAGAAGDGERDSVRDDGGRDRQSPHITAGPAPLHNTQTHCVLPQ